MNSSIRLTFGWIFLAALTAAGTFFGLDELDQRVGLAKLHLHEAMGVKRYEAAKKYVPPDGSDSGKKDEVVKKEEVVKKDDPAPVKKDDIGVIVKKEEPPTPVPGPKERESDKGRPPSTDPVRVRETVRVADDSTMRGRPVPPSGDSGIRRTSSGGLSDVPFGKPKDFDEINARLADVSGRAQGELNWWTQTAKSMPVPLGPSIQGALSSLRNLTVTAQRAMRAGDTTSAKRALDEAEQKLKYLQERRDQ